MTGQIFHVNFFLGFLHLFKQCTVSEAPISEECNLKHLVVWKK